MSHHASAIGPVLLVVAACGAPEPALHARWELSEPRAAVYERACKTCHEKEGTGAPLARDTAAWRERVQKGDVVLLENTINGFGGMPPLGTCMECDERDLELLVAYLAGLERPERETEP